MVQSPRFQSSLQVLFLVFAPDQCGPGPTITAGLLFRATKKTVQPSFVFFLLPWEM